MVAKVINEVRWEFPNGLTGKAWVFYGLEELRGALEDAGATVTVSVATAPTAGRQTAAHVTGAVFGPGDAPDRDLYESNRAASRAPGRRAYGRPDPGTVSGGNGTEFA